MDDRRDFSVLGRPLPRVDAYDKVTGKARYVDDMSFPNMLIGKILRSPYAHARIVGIDTSKAKDLPGVKAVITGTDLPERKYGTDPRFADEYALCRGKVRYIGDEVAAVAAVDEETAEKALDLIEVEYESLEPMFDVRAAMAPGKPQIHEGKERNVSMEIHLDAGDTERGFAEAEYVREDTFRSQPTFHAPLEPHAVLAQWSEEGKLTVWANKQIPFYIRRLLAHTLCIPEAHVRVIKPCIGGGFGGKGEMYALDVCAAYLSKLTSRPVKIVYSREESLVCTRRRHEMTITLKTAMKKDGTILAVKGELFSETGAYNSTGPLATYLATTFLNLPWKIPAVKVDSYLVYTNLPPSGPQRGHGVLEMRYAADCHLDLIARDLGIDPLDIRLKNAVHRGYRTANNMNVGSCGIAECLKRAAEKIKWREKKGKMPPYHGIGIAGMGYLSGVNLVPHTGAAAIVHVHEDGGVNLLTGAAEIGQGSDTYLAQLVAEEMGVPLEDVRVISGDTGVTPYDPGTFGSRVATMSGNAARNAGRDAMRQIKEVVADEMEANVGDLVARGRRIYVKGSPERSMPLRKALRAMQYRDLPMPVVGYGFYQAPTHVPDWFKAEDDPSATYSFGAQVAVVEVDPETGRINLKEMVNAHDVGLMINPMAVEGQLQGSIHMGAGHVLTEDVIMRDGLVMNPNLLEYKTPSPFEMPLVHGIAIETASDDVGPHGAKECGEGTEVSTLPAIVNAVFDATGVMIKDLPITPDKVLRALEEKERRG
ncbi:MAG: molybdopterin-dependent oxidoreductase [Deltaproteobacteria bacterium]|nr:molybdopterin-dependent oxidoreductase [Deltaproteobacteria bacterium]MBW2138811.1 molybdopterin-dependent oxidoreductase [Deltaproteobacteria bacterium]